MLDSKSIRMLQLLDKQVDKCNRCNLKSNGTVIPFWTPHSKYAIIGEAPGAVEVKQKTPFVGPSGQILTEELTRVGFNAKDFLIVNSVQCRPMHGGYSNGKPSELQIRACQGYIRKYLKVVNPEKILCLGNYAKYIFTGNIYGVLKQRGNFFDGKIKNFNDPNKIDINFPVLITVHPAYCIYNREEGIEKLRNDIMLFKNTEFERKVNWFLTEDDFKI